MERPINLEELESTAGKCHWRRLECIVFVNRIEMDKRRVKVIFFFKMSGWRRIVGDGGNRS